MQQLKSNPAGFSGLRSTKAKQNHQHLSPSILRKSNKIGRQHNAVGKFSNFWTIIIQTTFGIIRSGILPKKLVDTKEDMIWAI